MVQIRQLWGGQERGLTNMCAGAERISAVNALDAFGDAVRARLVDVVHLRVADPVPAQQIPRLGG